MVRGTGALFCVGLFTRENTSGRGFISQGIWSGSGATVDEKLGNFLCQPLTN